MNQGTDSKTPDYSEMSREQLERHCARMAQALADDKSRAFWHRYALGPMRAPSCLCCGQLPEKIAIQHMELPGIVVCEKCRNAALSPQAAPPAPEPVAWRFRHLNARWTYIEAEEYRLAPHGREGWTIEPLYAAQAEPKTLADIWEDLDHQDAMEYLAEFGGAQAAPEPPAPDLDGQIEAGWKHARPYEEHDSADKHDVFNAFQAGVVWERKRVTPQAAIGAPAETLREALEKILALDMSHDIFSAKAIARAALANERRGSPEVQMGYPTARSGESPEAADGDRE